MFFCFFAHDCSHNSNYRINRQRIEAYFRTNNRFSSHPRCSYHCRYRHYQYRIIISFSILSEKQWVFIHYIQFLSVSWLSRYRVNYIVQKHRLYGLLIPLFWIEICNYALASSVRCKLKRWKYSKKEQTRFLELTTVFHYMHLHICWLLNVSDIATIRSDVNYHILILYSFRTEECLFLSFSSYLLYSVSNLSSNTQCTGCVKSLSIIAYCCSYHHYQHIIKGLILGLRPASERRRYFVTTSLVGWVQA